MIVGFRLRVAAIGPLPSPNGARSRRDLSRRRIVGEDEETAMASPAGSRTLTTKPVALSARTTTHALIGGGVVAAAVTLSLVPPPLLVPAFSLIAFAGAALAGGVAWLTERQTSRSSRHHLGCGGRLHLSRHRRWNVQRAGKRDAAPRTGNTDVANDDETPGRAPLAASPGCDVGLDNERAACCCHELAARARHVCVRLRARPADRSFTSVLNVGDRGKLQCLTFYRLKS